MDAMRNLSCRPGLDRPGFIGGPLLWRRLPIKTMRKSCTPFFVALSILLGCVSCTLFESGSQGAVSPAVTASGQGGPVYIPDLPVGQPPYTTVPVSWKQRLDQPYVYIEHVGSYTETGALIPVVHRELVAQGLEPDGAPFGLFYDDPATVAAHQLRSRACVPIKGLRSPSSPLAYEMLPSTTVAYAYVSGAYPGVPRAYPHLYQYLQQTMNWAENGPIREIYLVAPLPGVAESDLITEIQIPGAPGGAR
ncbi:MAG: DNA gyrase inhibitor GyrI [Glaciecola sp.]|jgi:DNA gyrase inhibitor GyrI